MRNEKRSLLLSWRSLQWMIAAGVALLTIFVISSAGRTDNAPSQQDVFRLESRLSQLDQRINILEANMRNLEIQSRTRSTPSGGVSESELNLLRSVVQTLEQRLAYDECGLAKLDERTLTQASRKRSGADSKNPCRVNVDEPLPLLNRRE